MIDAEISARLKAILARPEFQPDAMDHIWEKLRRVWSVVRAWIDRMGPMEQWGLALGGMALLLVILFHLVRGYSDALEAPTSGRSEDGVRSENPAPDPGRLAARARRLAEMGQLREGARTLQQAVLISLCRQARLPWNPTAADWEWMKILPARSELAEFTHSAQAVAFGPQPTPEGFEVCWSRSRRWLEAST